jgi:hypothetical protein
MAATTTGPDFVSFQVRDRAVSAKFYEVLTLVGVCVKLLTWMHWTGARSRWGC